MNAKQAIVTHAFKGDDGVRYEVAYHREPWGAHAFTLRPAGPGAWYCQDFSRMDRELTPDEVRDYARGVVLVYVWNARGVA